MTSKLFKHFRVILALFSSILARLISFMKCPEFFFFFFFFNDLELPHLNSSSLLFRDFCLHTATTSMPFDKIRIPQRYLDELCLRYIHTLVYFRHHNNEIFMTWFSSRPPPCPPNLNLKPLFKIQR